MSDDAHTPAKVPNPPLPGGSGPKVSPLKPGELPAPAAEAGYFGPAAGTSESSEKDPRFSTSQPEASGPAGSAAQGASAVQGASAAPTPGADPAPEAAPATHADTVPTSGAAAQADTETEPNQPRDWRADLRRGWTVAAMVLAALLWWPVAFTGSGADWMHLPYTSGADGSGYRTGNWVLLGCLVAAGVVSALVKQPWPRFGIAAGLTVIAWIWSEGDVTFAEGERPVLAALAGIGMLLGLWVGAKAHGGSTAIATFLATVAGLSPATWSRGLLLAIAVALPFWAASASKVAPTIMAVVRVLVTWLVSVLIAVGLAAGFAAVPAGGLAETTEATRTVGDTFWATIRGRWLEIIEAAAKTYVGWVWLAVVIAVALVAVRTLLDRRAKATKSAT